MYESSHKQPPSITYLILNSKDLVSKSINSEKQIFFLYAIKIIKGMPPLCMGYNIITNLESTSWKLFVHQKQPPEASYKKSVSKNFLKVTGKHLCQSLFFDNVTDLRPATLLKKKQTPTQSFLLRILRDTTFFRAPRVTGSSFSLLP